MSAIVERFKAFLNPPIPEEDLENFEMDNTSEFTVPDLQKYHKASRADEVMARIKVNFVAMFASLGGLLYGYDTGIISGALIQITNKWDLSHRMQESITTAILVGAVVGAFISGKCSKKFGRRQTVLGIALLFFFGVLAASASPSPWFLIASRLFLGVAVGGSSQIIPTYIAELVPPERRGRMVTMFNISIGIGILLANVVSRIFADEERGDMWRFTMGIACIPAAILALAMLKLPETPRWLIDHGEISEARMVLRDLRPSRPVAVAEVKEIQANARLEQQEEETSTTWRSRWLRPSLVAGLGVAAFTQLSGLEMMIYYAPTILRRAQFSTDFSLWAAVGIAVVYLLFTIIGETVVDKVGRRGLMLAMIPGAAVSLLAFGAIFIVGPTPDKTITVVLLLLYMAFNAGGIQVVGWLIGSEIYPYAIRDAATSAHAAALWGANILATSTCLTLVEGIGMTATMWMYAGFNVIAWVYVLFLVPETKGHSLEEIEANLRAGNFYPWQQRLAKKKEKLAA